MNRRIIIVTIGVILVLQFVVFLFYGYLVQINVLSRPTIDPVATFFMSWIVFCIGIVIIWIGVQGG